MKKDIDNRKDIEILVKAFYSRVKDDKSIGPFFNEVVKVDWDKHLPVMYNFWENVLFHTGGYEGNPMNKHIAIHAIRPINPEHFAQWISLFNSTVEDLFSGPNAQQIKHRAQSIATLMQQKIIL